MTLGMMLMLLALPLLLVGSAFFSGSETALFSLTATQRMKLSQSRGLIARAITTLLSETQGLLITLLMGNMAVNVIYFVISSELVLQFNRQEIFGPAMLTVLTIAPLLLIILFGEVAPKLVAAKATMAFARLTAAPLYLVHRGLTPVRLASQWLIIAPLARLISPGPPQPLSVEELDALLHLSQHRGVIAPDEERVLQQVLDLQEIRVTELMTPRVDIVAYDLEAPPSELMRLIREHRPRQVPVYRGDMDRIEGILFSRQVLLRSPKTPAETKKLIRQVKFVPAQQHADRLLLEFRRVGSTVAIVVDEYGGTAGVVTLRDVVEHLIGDIPRASGEGIGKEDEDDDAPQVQKIGDGQWLCEASLSVREWLAMFRPMIAEQHRDALHTVSTLGGLVMFLSGQVAAVGVTATLGNIQLTVQQVEGRRIQQVRVELVQPESNDTKQQNTSSNKEADAS